MPAYLVEVLAFRLQHPSCETVIAGMDVEEEIINVITHQRGLKTMSAEVIGERHQIVLSPTFKQKKIIARHLVRMVSNPFDLARQLGMPDDLGGAVKLYGIEGITEIVVNI